MRRILLAGAAILAMVGAAGAAGYNGLPENVVSAFRKQAIVAGAPNLAIKKILCTTGSSKDSVYSCLYSINMAGVALDNVHFLAASDKKGDKANIFTVSWENWAKAEKIADVDIVSFGFATAAMVGLVDPKLSMNERHNISQEIAKATVAKETKIEKFPDNTGFIITTYKANINGTNAVTTAIEKK
ncbi:hypothetical protein [Candidatus Tokpelaia sp.]|uniref:hypothetical protein n=1 Tax=Candidatus Tokpelaia sp. TaxID=2233777 RepID=UPI00123C139D|nr:hypothetical protein [Candidatus Tokpelaia sp.]KAA6405796.1 hypothetical protein DPQ22_02940 [Candidatus Tokpelaia sp.]